MKNIKVLGPGCAKCKNTYNNVMEAIEQTGIAAEVVKIEDIDEMLKYNILVTPVLMIDGEAKVKGRVPNVAEIKTLLTQ